MRIEFRERRMKLKKRCNSFEKRLKGKRLKTLEKRLNYLRKRFVIFMKAWMRFEEHYRSYDLGRMFNDARFKLFEKDFDIIEARLGALERMLVLLEKDCAYYSIRKILRSKINDQDKVAILKELYL